MKTIKDAYEELNGDLNNTRDPHDSDEFLYYDIIGNYYICSDDKGMFVPERTKYICTVEEFNNYVDFLASNRGEATQSYAEYKIDCHECNIATEQENKVDYTSEEFWKDAPEGATHYGAGDSSNGKSAGWYDIKSNGSYLFMTKGGKSWLGDLNLTMIHSINSYFNPRPIQSPVYTQEMADAGVMPSVGMEFLHKGLVVTTLSTSKEHDGVVTFTCQDGLSIGCCWFNDAWVKPLTAPITLEEQAIKEACYIVDDSKRCNDTNINIDCSAAQKAVIVTLIKNGYTKPLTVEGK